MQTSIETSRRTYKNGMTLIVTTIVKNHRVQMQGTVQGQGTAIQQGPFEITAHMLQQTPALRSSGYTHFMRVGQGNFCMTPDEVKAWEAAAAQVHAHMMETGPEYRFAHLKDQRYVLICKISAIRDEEAYRKDRAWEREDEMGAVVDSEQFKKDLADAQQALHDFDAAHPDVIIRVREEKAKEDQEAHERFMRYD